MILHTQVIRTNPGAYATNWLGRLRLGLMEHGPVDLGSGWYAEVIFDAHRFGDLTRGWRTSIHA